MIVKVLVGFLLNPSPPFYFIFFKGANYLFLFSADGFLGADSSVQSVLLVFLLTLLQGCLVSILNLSDIYSLAVFAMSLQFAHEIF